MKVPVKYTWFCFGITFPLTEFRFFNFKASRLYLQFPKLSILKLCSCLLTNAATFFTAPHCTTPLFFFYSFYTSIYFVYVTVSLKVRLFCSQICNYSYLFFMVIHVEHHELILAKKTFSLEYVMLRTILALVGRKKHP